MDLATRMYKFELIEEHTPHTPKLDMVLAEEFYDVDEAELELESFIRATNFHGQLKLVTFYSV